MPVRENSQESVTGYSGDLTVQDDSDCYPTSQVDGGAVTGKAANVFHPLPVATTTQSKGETDFKETGSTSESRIIQIRLPHPSAIGSCLKRNMTTILTCQLFPVA